MEPPLGNKVDEAKCGTSCPATTFTPPSDQEGVDICGTTLHTMVSRDDMLIVSWFWFYVDLLHILYQLCLLRLHHWWRTRDWEDLCFPFHRGWRVGWHSLLKNLSSLLQRWDTWAQGSTVDKGRRQGGNLTHFRCAGGSVHFDFNYYPFSLIGFGNILFQGRHLEKMVCHWGWLWWGDGSGEFPQYQATISLK